MAFCKLVTVLLLIHNTGGLSGAKVRSSIVGGHNALKGRWPWMVHLNITSDGINQWRCGGTILDHDWVLTAANCWDKKLAPNIFRSMAWVGSYSLQKASARYMGILYVISHPKYQATSSGYVNNIALVKLNKKIIFSKDVFKVNLPNTSQNFSPSSKCWITGWGNVKTGGTLYPETLQELEINIIDQSVCNAVHPELTSDMICAGDQAGGKDACKGDYGGPLVSSDFFQVGIMSYGSRKGCGLPGHPGVYTKVSEYLHFINSYIKRDEEASSEI
uniref:Peptidase S1 domain-containing protein n=1 Tax=Mola mola TaxID=94237 RepID=A0A3Q3WEJ4_MOLML